MQRRGHHQAQKAGAPIPEVDERNVAEGASFRCLSGAHDIDHSSEACCVFSLLDAYVEMTLQAIGELGSDACSLRLVFVFVSVNLCLVGDKA